MTTIYDLPNDIINIILYDNLRPRDIQTCYLASDLFHVLSNYQKEVIKNAKLGFYYCCSNGYLESAKLIYKINCRNNITTYIHQQHELTGNTPFLESCINGHIEVAKWLHNLSIETKKSIRSGYYKSVFIESYYMG